MQLGACVHGLRTNNRTHIQRVSSTWCCDFIFELITCLQHSKLASWRNAQAMPNEQLQGRAREVDASGKELYWRPHGCSHAPNGRASCHAGRAAQEARRALQAPAAVGVTLVGMRELLERRSAAQRQAGARQPGVSCCTRRSSSSSKLALVGTCSFSLLFFE